MRRVTRSSTGRSCGGACWRRRSPACHWSSAVSKGTASRLAREPGEDVLARDEAEAEPLVEPPRVAIVVGDDEHLGRPRVRGLGDGAGDERAADPAAAVLREAVRELD